MSHKAYAFDWSAFEKDELYRIVLTALASSNPSEIIRYIDANLEFIRDPYEGDRLSDDWKELLENHDVHEFADFALTRFYDPAEDCGISDQWRAIDQRLPAIDRAALLGTRLGSNGQYFDPGRQGSYFKRPDEVNESLNRVQKLHLPGLEDYRKQSLKRFKELLEDCVETGRGVYVTF